MAKNKQTIKKILWGALSVLLMLAGIVAYLTYNVLYVPNTETGKEKSEIIFIPTGSNFNDVLNILTKANILKNKKSFVELAKLRKYPTHIKPGRYRIMADMNNIKLLNMLRNGLQEPVMVTFTNIRTKDQLISQVCKRIEADSTELLAFLNNDSFIKKSTGLNSETILAMFIPNSYQFYWNTSAKQFIERMYSEYKKFWTTERKAKAAKLNLTPIQVSVLASIVQSEQQLYTDERPIIAGLYLNRLRIGMALQSDPTVVYALGDFSIKRVLDIHKAVESPYNTYKYSGLPPGPIYMSDISSIDAVLNFQRNDYLYMCAKEDFSGRHNFARSLQEHNRNADRYRRALNTNRIFR